MRDDRKSSEGVREIPRSFPMRTINHAKLSSSRPEHSEPRLQTLITERTIPLISILRAKTMGDELEESHGRRKADKQARLGVLRLQISLSVHSMRDDRKSSEGVREIPRSFPMRTINHAKLSSSRPEHSEPRLQTLITERTIPLISILRAKTMGDELEESHGRRKADKQARLGVLRRRRTKRCLFLRSSPITNQFVGPFYER